MSQSSSSLWKMQPPAGFLVREYWEGGFNEYTDE